jgi:hypothetical protein
VTFRLNAIEPCRDRKVPTGRGQDRLTFARCQYRNTEQIVDGVLHCDSGEEVLKSRVELVSVMHLLKNLHLTGVRQRRFSRERTAIPGTDSFILFKHTYSRQRIGIFSSRGDPHLHRSWTSVGALSSQRPYRLLSSVAAPHAETHRSSTLRPLRLAFEWSFDTQHHSGERPSKSAVKSVQRCNSYLQRERLGLGQRNCAFAHLARKLYQEESKNERESKRRTEGDSSQEIIK